MKKYYLFTALIVLFGLNLLYQQKQKFKIEQVNPLNLDVDAAGNVRAPATAAIDTVKEPKKESANLSWLKQEAQQVGRTTDRPAAAVLRIRERAARLTEQDRQELKKVAVNPQEVTDERFLAVFVLSESPAGSAEVPLREISEAPIGKTTNDRQYSDELVIRMQALEASVKRLSPSEAQSFLRSYLSRVADPQLAKHARYLQK